MGHTLTTHGLKPDEKKVEAILEMDNPTDVECCRLLGYVTYLAFFLNLQLLWNQFDDLLDWKMNGIGQMNKKMPWLKLRS